MTERYLIVGGAGYFGSRLAEALATHAQVSITYRSAGAARRDWMRRAGVEARCFDTGRDRALPFDGPFEAVINLAMPGATEAARDEAPALENARRVAEACLALLANGAARMLVHFSTFHVYGAAGRDLYREDDEPAPGNAYGRIHLEVERRVLSHEGTLVVRPSNLAGSPAHAELGDQAKLIFLDLCHQAARGAMVLHNDGASHRDFLAFDAAISAVRSLLGRVSAGPRLFNLAAGESIRLDALAAIIREAAGGDTSITLGSGQDNFRRPFRISIGRLQALGWSPAGSIAREASGAVGFFRGAP